jgi:hypothetical protein
MEHSRTRIVEHSRTRIVEHSRTRIVEHSLWKPVTRVRAMLFLCAFIAATRNMSFKSVMCCCRPASRAHATGEFHQPAQRLPFH